MVEVLEKYVKYNLIKNIHCVKSVHIRSYSGPRFPAVGMNIQSESRKIWSRITPNTDTFYAVISKKQKENRKRIINFLDFIKEITTGHNP